MRIDLKIGGEIIPLYFGMVAFEEMQKLVADYMGTNKYAADVVWAGYLNQCAIDCISPILSYSDVMRKLEDHFFSPDSVDSNIKDVLDSFDKSKAGSKLFEVIDKAVDIVEGVSEDLEKVKKKETKTRRTQKLKK
ncbi:hypothetical protein ORI89_07500 [Sphingobacterium sp. UT-1RO-CII-1]|uniref:hypothetical protein n=1 Tax=Sphingobacterium sp. UT-1RO-CII-1 TaxID=2995225 RepID=UPI00227CDB83|nr:hypothetical protein [Sphingobacterium sp. UT-1RO-CII-1]MCY4779490.1 hypothetical protein [Sphingobacterium sp. UT-1RO-CII-1]